MKKDIILKYGLNKDDSILCANIFDRHDACLNKNIPTCTNFLDLRQQTVVKTISKEFKVNYAFYGGYEDADRKIFCFLPDYTDKLNNLKIAEVTHNGYKELSHRDYLGSLLSIGIKRELTGDIIVFEKGAQIIIKEEIADFIYANYSKAGHTALNCEIKDISLLKVCQSETKTATETVSSLRLDGILAAGYNISRSIAVKFIESGKVFVNDLQILKCDKQVKEGDKLNIRGKGKIKIEKVGGTSRKGRIFIDFLIY